MEFAGTAGIMYIQAGPGIKIIFVEWITHLKTKYL